MTAIGTRTGNKTSRETAQNFGCSPDVACLRGALHICRSKCSGEFVFILALAYAELSDPISSQVPKIIQSIGECYVIKILFIVCVYLFYSDL